MQIAFQDNHAFHHRNYSAAPHLLRHQPAYMQAAAHFAGLFLVSGTLLNSYESGYDIRTVQELLKHTNLQTTMIYTHVATKNLLGVRSPLDR